MTPLSLKFKNLSQLSRQKCEWIDHQDGQLHQHKDQFEFHFSSKRRNPISRSTFLLIALAMYRGIPYSFYISGMENQPDLESSNVSLTNENILHKEDVSDAIPIRV
jgi:hypothetical protein